MPKIIVRKTCFLLVIAGLLFKASISSTLIIGDLTHTGQAILFPDDQEPPEETLNFHWTNDNSDKVNNLKGLLKRLKCAFWSTNAYDITKDPDIHQEACLAFAQCQTQVTKLLFDQCLQLGCGKKCKNSFNLLNCMDICSQQLLVDSESGHMTRHMARYTEETSPRDKRYRLGLYDCISSYCNDLHGAERKSCIVNYCHRSINSDTDE